MSSEEILARVTAVFRDVFDDDKIILTRTMTAEDIDAWDSLSHVSLIVAIEREFKVKFGLMDIKPLKNVGEFLELVQRKTS